MARFDVAVIGLGGIGSATLAELARRGVAAVGIERFEPGHDRGSSHGETRIIRLGYFEHPSYVPLLRRAYETWRDIEARSGERLLTITGIVEIGPATGELIAGTTRAARDHGIPTETLDAAALMARFPAFRVPADYVGVYQADGGHLAVERAVRAQVALAATDGATLRTGERVLRLEPIPTGMRIVTDRDAIEARTVVVTTGAWTPQLLPGLPVPLRVTREVIGWFEPAQPMLLDTAGRFPVFLLESRHGVHYGFPCIDGRVKIAKHHGGEPADPDDVDRAINARDEALIRDAIADHIPAANGPMREARTCLYTSTPDHDFAIGPLPGLERVIVASPCSGHGFKFAPVLGEALADLATEGRTRHDLSRFALDRFG